jgi:hypothetical protein
MTTSGTVSTTVVTVQNLIDSGARRAGKLAEELTSEEIFASKQSLYYLLSNLVNYGVQYWAIQKNVIGLYPNQYEYLLPVGTNDVLNANYRYFTTNTAGAYSSSGVTANAFDGQYINICQLSTNTGYIGINNGSGSPIYMATVGILSAVTGTVNYQIQSSQDGSTWTTIVTPTTTSWVSGQWIYNDLDPSTSAPYWRILQTSGVNMGFYQVAFGSNPTEIPMFRMNRDDYVNLPNKNFLNNYPLQYWLNRTIPQPTMNLWPAPAIYSPQIVAWCTRYVQDVGALNGQIEIPQRWYLAIQNMLAHQMSMELPQVDPARIAYCEQQAEKYLHIVQEEERDKSPIYFAPNISVYTR